MSNNNKILNNIKLISKRVTENKENHSEFNVYNQISVKFNSIDEDLCQKPVKISFLD